MTVVEKLVRRAIQEADKHVRSKKYSCLFPGCENWASRCHSIQRALCEDALARDGHVYTVQPNFSAVIGQQSLASVMRVVRVGVSDAGTFLGFCGTHDHQLFRGAEGSRANSGAMFLSLHLRAITLEYCRKRRSADYLSRVSELLPGGEVRDFCSGLAEGYANFANAFRELYLGYTFNLMSGAAKDTIEYYCLPFSRNLEVSCCGMVNVIAELDAALGFNLISYRDFAVLIFTTFGATQEHLHGLLAGYRVPQQAQQLVNDVAFRMCEEPLLAPALWERLTEEQQLRIRVNLRPPTYRSVDVDCDVISVTIDDLVEPTPELLRRLYDRVYIKPGDIQFYGSSA
jgi:hypothetical protein